MNAFSLVVAAVVAVALLGLLFVYVFPAFPQTESPRIAIGKAMDAAVISPGAYVATSPLRFQKEDIVLAEHLQSPDTHVIIGCTASELCCKGNDCSDAPIAFDETHVTFNQVLEHRVYARCLYANNLYTCWAYFGGRVPPQVKVKTLSSAQVADGVMDLAEDPVLRVQVVLDNIGSADALNPIAVHVRLERVEASRRERVFAQERTLEGLEEGSDAKLFFYATVPYAGEYELFMEAKSEEVGSASETFSFTASGEPPSACTTAQIESLEVYPETGSIEELRGRVVAKAGCFACETASSCALAWRAAGREAVQAGPEYAYVTPK